MRRIKRYGEIPEVQEAYTLASNKNVTFYDTIFVALAHDLGLRLKTFDKTQKQPAKKK